MNKDEKKQMDDRVSLVVQYKAVFNTSDGEKVLNDLMIKNHVFQGIFDKDHATMAFRAGQLSVIVQIIDMLGIDISKYKEMYKNNYLNQE